MFEYSKINNNNDNNNISYVITLNAVYVDRTDIALLPWSLKVAAGRGVYIEGCAPKFLNKPSIWEIRGVHSAIFSF